MKKILISAVVALLMFLAISPTALAADPPEGTITINMSGSDYKFQVNTWLYDAQDIFTGEAYSTLEMHQTIRYIPSGTWTYDAPDIDRFAQFYGEGSILAVTNYDSSAKWYWAESTMYAFVESDTYGFLGQNLHLDSQGGGVKDVDQWKKQRDMVIQAEGNYGLGFAGWDTRSDDYSFDFYASDSGSSGYLYVDTIYTGTEHGSGQWYTPDRLIIDFVYNWTGSPGVVCNWEANTGGDINMAIDLINNFISGSGTIY